MAKKLKKLAAGGTIGRRSVEKFRRAVRSFDKAIIYYILLVIAAALVSVNGNISLRSTCAHGFAVNFLWLPAALPLLLADGIAACFNGAIPMDGSHHIYLLGICDIVLAAAVWCAVRFLAIRKQSARILRNARIFVMIIVIWGIFQICCCGVKLALDRSQLDDAVTAAEVNSDHK